MQPFLLVWNFLDADEHKIISKRGLEILEEQKTKNDCIHDVSNRFVCDGRKRCKEQCEDCKYYN